MNEATRIGVDESLLECAIDRIVAEAATRIYQATREGFVVRKAWIYQQARDVAKFGEEAAPHYVGYRDPEGVRHGKNCGTGQTGYRLAQKLRQKIEAELICGTFSAVSNKPWDEFLKEYKAKILSGRSLHTQEQAGKSLAFFARIVKPKRVSAIKTATIDAFVSKRRTELRPHTDQTISPATVNADLRNIKAALTVAKEWGYLAEVPRVRMEREPSKLPIYVEPAHFAALYQVADQAKQPACQGYSRGDWWRALLVFIYVGTGWRIDQALCLSRQDVDLAAETAITRHHDNKGHRDMRVKLHPLAVDHLRKLAGFGDKVFPCSCSYVTLLRQLHRLCKLAGVPKYGFHSLRKGFGSMNAARIPLTALQALMQHASSRTTQKFYINPLAGQEEVVARLHVPEGLASPRKAAGQA